MANLAGIKILTFDCYGTMIDWESGLKCVLNAWAAEHGLTLRDDALLEAYARHETAIEHESPFRLYPQCLEEVLRRTSTQHGVAVSERWALRLGASVPDWPAFTDSAEALIALKRRFKLGVLSNVDRISFAASNRKLMVDFDLVVTAQDAGSYKPDTRNFEAMLARLATMGIARQEVCHVAQSLHHDHVPAKAVGLRSIWINRRAGRAGSGATVIPTAPVGWEREFPTLREFAAWAVADPATQAGV